MLDIVFIDIEKYRQESIKNLSYKALKTFTIITIITLVAILGLYIYLQLNGGIRGEELMFFYLSIFAYPFSTFYFYPLPIILY